MRNSVKIDFAVIFQSEYHILESLLTTVFFKKSVVEGLV